MADRLNAGEYLDLDPSLWSANGVYRLILQARGQPCSLRRPAQALGVEYRGPTRECGGHAGRRNVVVYAQGGDALWATGTA